MKLRDMTYNPTMIKGRRITTQPEIMIHMLKNDLTTPGRVYYALRLIDYQKAGVVTVKYAKETLCNTKNSHFLLSSKQMTKILNDYNGVFWLFENKHIVPFSPQKIANNLGMPKYGYKSVMLTEDHIFKGKRNFSAICYAAYVTTLGDVPTSRSQIKEDTGISPTAQIRYEKVAGILNIAAAITISNVYRIQNEDEYYKLREEIGSGFTKVKERPSYKTATIYAKRLGNVRYCFGLKPSVDTRRKEAVNSKVASVDSGKRNQRIRKTNLPHDKRWRYSIINGEDAIYRRDCDVGFIRNPMTVEYKEYYSHSKGKLVRQRIVKCEDVPCLLFTQYDGKYAHTALNPLKW